MRTRAATLAFWAISTAAFAQSTQGDLLGGPFDPPRESVHAAEASLEVAPLDGLEALSAPERVALINATPAVPILARAEPEPQPQPQPLPPAPAPIVVAAAHGSVQAAPPPLVAARPQASGPRVVAITSRRGRRAPHPQTQGPTAELASFETPAPAPSLPPILDGPPASHRIGYGYDLCLDAEGGLRLPSEIRAPALVLWRCNGGDNQTAALAGGVLRFGAAHDQAVRAPIAPLQGCDTYQRHSAARAYVFRLCAGSGETSFDATNPARLVVTAYAPAGRPALVRGAPLLVDRLPAGETPAPQWELNRRGNLIALSGSALCLTPPSQDLSEGAPLYLDLCSAPYRLDETLVRDGAQRARAAFPIDWRF